MRCSRATLSGPSAVCWPNDHRGDDVDRSDDRIDEIRQQLSELPQEVANAIGARPTDDQWPEPPQSSSGKMPDVGGPSASQFEPVVSRLEGVARMLEQRLGDQAAGWGSPPKVYEQQSLSGLIGQMPVTSAINFADQSFGIPPHAPQPFGESLSIPSPNAPAVADPAIGTPTAAPATGAMSSSIAMPVATAGSPGSAANIPMPVAPPAPVQGQSSVTTEGGGDISGATASILEHIVQAIEMLAEKVAGKETTNQPGGAGEGSRGQPDAYPGTRPEGPTSVPELQPAAVPSWKDAHQGGASRPWMDISRA